MGRVVGGRFELEEHLGRGAMGEVWGCCDQRDGQRVAIKVLRKERQTRRDLLMFRREFHTLRGLSHPSIVQARDFGSEQSETFYTMELLTGPPLSNLAPLPLERACTILRDIASALAYVHSRSLIHRDLSPANVRLDGDGRAHLIDFGLLATVGFTGPISGTPPFMAPEVLQGGGLDQRTDLFGLGALGYWLLTGQHAYPAERIEDLHRLWMETPPAPSAIDSSIPAEADELLLGLLSKQRNERPSRAAEVIEHLESIGNLPPRDSEDFASYLAQVSLVGRDSEVLGVSERIEQAVDGTGGAIVLEGPAGFGKSRLLQEIGLYSQITGARYVQVRASDVHGPWSSIEALVTATASAVEIPGPPPSVPRGDAAIGAARAHIERQKTQVEICQWFGHASRTAPLVLAVDDIESCDEPSLATFIRLTQQLPGQALLTVFAFRTDSDTEANISGLRRHASVIQVGKLTTEQERELIRSMFGQLEGEERLFAWLGGAAAGNPMHLIEMVRTLVDANVLCFRAGQWILLDGLQKVAPPTALADALDVRLRALPAETLEVGQLLALLDAEATIWQLMELSQFEPEHVFSAVDELASFGHVVGDNDHYELSHGRVRDAFLRSISRDKKPSLHQRVAHLLLAQGEPRGAGAAEVGMHLVEAGQDIAGADLLAQAGRYYYRQHAAKDIVPILERALAIYERHGVQKALCLEIRHMLVTACTAIDLPLAKKYAGTSLEIAWKAAGLSVAQNLGTRVPGPFPLYAGMAYAYGRRFLERRHVDHPSPFKAALTVMQLGVATSSVHHNLGRPEAIRSIAERLRALHGIPFASAATDLCWSMYYDLMGDHAARSARIDSAMRTLKRANILLADEDARQARSLIMLMDAFRLVVLQDPSFEDRLSEVEHDGYDFYQVAVDVARLCYRRARGEEAEAQRLYAETQPIRDRVGDSWQLEWLHTRMSACAYCITGDVLGLSRSMERLTHQLNAGYTFAGFRDLVKGVYLREVGKYDESEELLRAVVAGQNQQGAAVIARVCLAELLLARAKYQEAVSCSLEAADVAAENAGAQHSFGARAQIPLALCRAHMGHEEEGIAILESALSTCFPSPTISGFLHDARARIALQEGDEESYREHLEHVRSWFEPTKNPVLLARLARLRRLNESETQRERASGSAVETFFQTEQLAVPSPFDGREDDS